MRNKLSIITCLFALVIFNSCKHDNFDEYVGPGLCPTSNFRFTKEFRVSSEQVDFNKFPGIYGDSIQATFNEVVTWSITLTGSNSGAIKNYKGRSSQIDTVWYGQSNSPSATFQAGEDVSVNLVISCLKDPYVKHIKILDANKFKTNIGPYAMVSDFDGAGYVSNSIKLGGYNTTGWSSYFTLPNQLTKFSIGPSESSLSAPQGSNYITLQGTAGPASWFVGGTYVNSPTTMPGNNPNEVYFNAFISSGNNSTTSLAITLGAGANYVYVMPLQWSGWKMVSIKLSDFKNSSGTPLSNVSAITTLDFGLNCASKQGQSTEVDLDFIVFSNNGPFYQ